MTKPPAVCQGRDACRRRTDLSLEKTEQPQDNNDQDNSDEDPDKVAWHCTLLLRFK